MMRVSDRGRSVGPAIVGVVLALIVQACVLPKSSDVARAERLALDPVFTGLATLWIPAGEVSVKPAKEPPYNGGSGVRQFYGVAARAEPEVELARAAAVARESGWTAIRANCDVRAITALKDDGDGIVTLEIRWMPEDLSSSGEVFAEISMRTLAEEDDLLREDLGAPSDIDCLPDVDVQP